MPRSPDAATRSTWLSRLSRFSCSGLTISQFCARERVSLASFYQWRKRLANEFPARRPEASAFQAVEILTAASSSGAAVSIRLANGTTLDVLTREPEVVSAVVREVARTSAGAAC